MGKHRLRLLVCGVGSLLLILTSTLALDWFRATIGGSDLLSISLRSVHACSPFGDCAKLPLSSLKGFFAGSADGALWGSLLFCGFVGFQVGTRFFAGVANERITKIGFAIGALVLSSALAAGYLFAPETTGMAIGEFEVQRTWAPLMLFVGLILGYGALWLAISAELTDDNVGEYRRLEMPKLAVPALKPLPSSTVPNRISNEIAAPVDPTSDTVMTPSPANQGILTPVPSAPAVPVIARLEEIAQAPTNPGDPAPGEAPPERPVMARASTAVTKMATRITTELLRKKLLYATAVVEINAAGIEGRREDGLTTLVKWQDIVGVVARRLPPAAPYEGITFVDLVSTSGSTLRILPWTRMTGDQIGGEAEERARTLVQMVVARGSDVHVDPATRTFYGGRGPAAQLPDAETLAAHDARLA